MHIALSTRALSAHRLNTTWLNKIADAGIPAIELFCARQHLDYRDQGQIDDLGHWLRDAPLQVISMHSPLHSDTAGGLSGPSSHINITETTKAKRIQMVDEVKRAVEIAETLPFTYLVQHLGGEYEDFDERKIDAAFSSLEELKIFAKHRGVEILLENLHSDFASAERLHHFNSITHLKLKYCLDVGHAHLSTSIAAAWDLFGSDVRLVHIHDNNGKEDSHLLPLAPSTSGTISWQRVMQRLRRDAPNAPVVLELGKALPDAAQNPFAEVRRVFERLENLTPLDDREQ